MASVGCENSHYGYLYGLSVHCESLAERAQEPLAMDKFVSGREISFPCGGQAVLLRNCVVGRSRSSRDIMFGGTEPNGSRLVPQRKLALQPPIHNGDDVSASLQSEGAIVVTLVQ